MIDVEFRHARDSIERLCEQTLPYNLFIDRLLSLLREAVPFDRSAVMMVDPETVMPIAGTVLDIPFGKCHPFWEYEYGEQDRSGFADLPSVHDRLQSFQVAGNGVGRKNVRFRTLYDDLDVVDELRASFSHGGTCWGVATFLRNAENGRFSDRENRFVRDLAPTVALGLRRTVLADLVESRTVGPGIIVFDTHGLIEMMTPEAERWLDELELQAAGETFSPATLVLAEVAGRARSLIENKSAQAARLRARTRTGRWLNVHASCLQNEGRASNKVGVVIEPAPTSDLASLLVEAFDLTRRERQVLELLASGCSTKEIARKLRISFHTARDHVKVIFDKVNVRSRGELLSRIFWQHAHDRLGQHFDHLPG